MLTVLVLAQHVAAQFLSYDAIRMRVPGRCHEGDYDCGFGQCVSVNRFHDGKPDCRDGSDEWCIFGQISCGAYCADVQHTLPCILHPTCDGSSRQLPWCKLSKEKLCADRSSFPCKGYGECVLWEWLLDGKKDCIDGSDEDPNYVLPLEHGFRCYRNRSGLVLPAVRQNPARPRPPAVPGCTLCGQGHPQTLPPLPPPHGTNPFDATTPKYPFATLIPYPIPPENFPFPGTTRQPYDNEFFPPFPERPSVYLSTLPPDEGKYGEFFPTRGASRPSATPPPAQTEPPWQPTDPSVRIYTIRRPTTTKYPIPPDEYPENRHTTRPPFTYLTTIEPDNEWEEQRPSETGGYEEEIVPLRPGGMFPQFPHTRYPPWEHTKVHPTTHPTRVLPTIPAGQHITEEYEYTTTEYPGFATAETETSTLATTTEAYDTTSARTTTEETESSETTRSSTSTSSTRSVTSPTATTTSELSRESACVKDVLQKAKTSEDKMMCKCENGQFSVGSGACQDNPSLMTLNVHLNDVCGFQDLSSTEKQEIVYQRMTEKLNHNVCIRSKEVDGGIVANIDCDNCDVSETLSLLRVAQNDHESVNFTSAALGKRLCSYSSLNHCHMFADCIVHEDPTRYSCKCRKGTTDVSRGVGRQCDGIPEDEDCIMIFGVCLIVWLLFLLGFLLLLGLCFLFCCRLYRHSCACCKNIAIHPENAAGLQRVVIGNAAAAANLKGDMPHMKMIFADSLRRSAKNSTSVASALALAELRKKNKVSRAPEMSKVLEVDNESPSPVAEPSPREFQLPKVGSGARIGMPSPSHEFEVFPVETPILEKNSSSVSLISAGESAPQLPNLPLPLPIPITTGPEPHKEDSPVQEPEEERPPSSHSVGVQPTIWETYRVLGAQYSKAEDERKSSVDSLDALIDARLASDMQLASSTTIESPPRPSVKPAEAEKPADVPLPAKQIETVIEMPEIETDQTTTQKSASEESHQEMSNEEAKEKERHEKLADMLGVTLDSPSSSATEKEEEHKNKDVVASLEDSSLASSTADQSVETAALIEMARRGIDLPLSPGKNEDTENKANFIIGTPDSPQNPLPSESTSSDAPKEAKPESRKSSAKSRIPSATQRRSTPELEAAPIFVPWKAREDQKRVIKNRKTQMSRLHPSSKDVPVSTDESDPEVAFFKRLQQIREDVSRPMKSTGRRIVKRRKPVRTLSSISEKSAEIAAEAALQDMPIDKSISCPPTTRSYLEWRPMSVKQKTKLIEARGDYSDVDIPTHVVDNVVSSPDIPDVTLNRHSTAKARTIVNGANGNGASYDNYRTTKTSVTSRSRPVTKSSRDIDGGPTSAQSPREDVDFPDNVSHTSRSTRHSVISRKIALRKSEMRMMSNSAHDLRGILTARGSKQNRREARSVENLAHRKPWNNTPCRESDRDPWDTFLPPITPRQARAVTSSPAHNHHYPHHRQLRSDSHLSLTSLPSRSPSFMSSPYFDPVLDSNKPPKEELWWSPKK